VEDWIAANPTFMQDVLNANMVGGDAHNNPVPAAPPAPPAAPVPPAAPQDIEPMIPNAKGKIYLNLTTLYGSMDPEEATELTDIIFLKKENILEKLKCLNSPVNSQILWQDGGDTIRNPQSGKEYQPKTLDKILDSLQRYGRESYYYKRFLNDRINSIKNSDLVENLQREDLPMDKLNELNQAKFVRWRGDG
jgi:hypothetical protein